MQSMPLGNDENEDKGQFRSHRCLLPCPKFCQGLCMRGTMGLMGPWVKRGGVHRQVAEQGSTDT